MCSGGACAEAADGLVQGGRHRSDAALVLDFEQHRRVPVGVGVCVFCFMCLEKCGEPCTQIDITTASLDCTYLFYLGRCAKYSEPCRKSASPSNAEKANGAIGDESEETRADGRVVEHPSESGAWLEVAAPSFSTTT
mmetsp:Transcript_72500/g.145864  ORF Transcript_72500/g.145864 Transcript_72500/m.145864 type:complete len:137 (-) Transcript_72500:916-1326(-)